MNMSQKTSKLTTLAMLCAISYVVMVVGRIPISTVDFLKYDPKDAVIAISGFLFGPLPALSITLVVSVIEMVTVSSTGPIGLLMNVLATCAFACTAAYIYKKQRTLGGAVAGLIAGTILMTIVMLLWNYLITPIYMGYPREAVVKMLVPVFLPFNLVKGGLNMAVTLLVYKPVATALRRAGLLPAASKDGGQAKNHFYWGTTLVALVILATCILFVLSVKGMI